MARTFKQLQDEVLQWMADENDAGLMRNLVKQSLDKSQRKLLTSEQLDFMLSPTTTLTTVSGQRVYPLPDNFLSMLYVQNATSGDYLEEIPPKSVLEADEGFGSLNDGELLRFMITTVEGVRVQPATAGAVTVTPSGGSEAAANGVVVQGLTATGAWVEETLSSGSTWASLTTTNSFKQITNVIKTGTTWTRTITVTSGSTTILTLTASEFSKQYQQLEFVASPTSAVTMNFRYFTRPVDLVYDNQTPQVPEAYRDVLVFDALLLLPGFTRATPEELQVWVKQREELHQTLKQNYQQSRSLGARARRIRLIERVG